MRLPGRTVGRMLPNLWHFGESGPSSQTGTNSPGPVAASYPLLLVYPGGRTLHNSALRKPGKPYCAPITRGRLGRSRCQENCKNSFSHCVSPSAALRRYNRNSLLLPLLICPRYSTVFLLRMQVGFQAIQGDSISFFSTGAGAPQPSPGRPR